MTRAEATEKKGRPSFSILSATELFPKVWYIVASENICSLMVEIVSSQRKVILKANTRTQ